MPRLDPITVREIFSDAVALPPAQRKRFLDQACGGDSGLRARVQSLLDALANDEQFLAAPTVDPHGEDGHAGSGAGTLQFDEAIGTVLGPYKLLERLGEGGFGTVYLAEQEEPVRRTVAVKVIKLGMDTRQVIARFEAERQALAMMDHPHIAKVFDAGTTATGRPYFVMELVKGLPITQYCDQHRVPLRERLALFTDVCHAVQHAHQKGIIHRDLKPSNVLVSRHDDKPVVKVIDFGIVKATSERLTQKTVHTEWRQLIGTPTYMSPEQAGLSDLDIDTRSDIYSLGVLLYELLTGSTPFDAEQLCKAGGDELRRIIREVEPPKPSTRLSSLLTGRKSVEAEHANKNAPHGDSSQAVDASIPHFRSGALESNSSYAASIAAFRRTDPTGLTRALRGELDWIVMKCLEKNRARRYEAASALALDVNRHLAGEPVVAAPPSRLYRISKALRRHRAAAVVTAGFVVLIAAGLFGMGAMWRTAAQARDAESDQRARAETISTFLKDTLTLADPTKAKGEKLTVRDALDRAAKRIDDGALRDQPLVEAELRVTIGETYFSLSLHPESEAQFRAAEAIQTRELGQEHPDTLRTRIKLAKSLYHTRAADPSIAETTLAALRRVLGPEHPDTLRAADLLGMILCDADRFTEGEALLLASIEIRRRVFGADHPDRANSLNSLGHAYIYHGLAHKAEPLHREAYRIHSQAFGEDDPRTLLSLDYLGSSLYNQNRAQEAEPLLRKVFETRLRVLGPDHPQTCPGDLGAALNRMGRYAEAERYLREALDAQMRSRGQMNLSTIHGQRFLAGNLKRQKRYDEAEVLLREALRASRELFGPENFDTTVRVMCTLADVLAVQEKDAEAEQVAREVLEIQRRQTPHPDAAELIQSSTALMTVLRRQGRSDEAVQVERDLIDFMIRQASKPDAGPQYLYLAAWRLLSGPIESLRDSVKGIELVRKLGQHADTDALQLNYAAWHLLTTPNEKLRDPALALEFALRANELTHHKQPDHLDTLALAFHRTGDTAKAIEVQLRAISQLAADAPDRADYEAQLRTFQAATQPSDDNQK